jgi:hypothetical protein
MNKYQNAWLAVLTIVAGFTQVALAAEYGGQSTATKTTTAAPAAKQATATSPTSPAQTKQIQGSITTLDLKSPAPTVALKDATGQTWVIGVDPKGTTVWSGSQVGNLDQLKVGSQVKIWYEEKTGRKLAKKVEIVQPVATATSSAGQPAGQQ